MTCFPPRSPTSPTYCACAHDYLYTTPLRATPLRAPEPESDPTDLSGVMQAVGVAVPAVTSLLQGIAESRERRIQDRVAAEALCARVEACTLMVTHLGKAGASATAISEAVTEALSTACETFRAAREESEEEEPEPEFESGPTATEDAIRAALEQMAKKGPVPEPKKA